MFYTWLREQLEQQYGELAEAIWNGLCTNRVTSLRINTLKTDKEYVKNELNESGLNALTVPFYSDALILPSGSESAVRKMSIYNNGEIYLQSLSAMIPPLMLDAKPGEDILDMCAAPGGKTSQIVQLTENKAMVTACEPDRIRCERLRSNLKRLGCERVNVLNTDARKLDDFLKFDRILLDAPCSGSGTLRLGTETDKNGFSQKLMQNSAKLQTELLRKASKLLKRGGHLVYSTCSLLFPENDAQTAAILKTGKLRLVPIEDGLIPGIPLLPGKIPGTVTVLPDSSYEGFYISVFEKTE